MPTTPTIPNEPHTYEEWQQLGYQVQYGERSTSRNEYGRALFSPAQVRPRYSRPAAPGEYRPAVRRSLRAADPRPAPRDREQVREQLGTWDITANAIRAELDSMAVSPSPRRMFWASSDNASSAAQWTYTFMDEFTQVEEGLSIEQPKLLQRAVSEYAPQGEPTGFQKFARRTK